MSYPSKKQMYDVIRYVFSLDTSYAICDLPKLYEDDNLLLNNKVEYITINDFISALDQASILQSNLLFYNTEGYTPDIDDPDLDDHDELDNNDDNDNNISKKSSKCIGRQSKHNKTDDEILEQYLPSNEMSSFYNICYCKAVVSMLINNTNEKSRISNQYLNVLRQRFSFSYPLYTFFRFVSAVVLDTIRIRRMSLMSIIERSFRYLLNNTTYTNNELEYSCSKERR